MLWTKDCNQKWLNRAIFTKLAILNLTIMKHLKYLTLLSLAFIFSCEKESTTITLPPNISTSSPSEISQFFSSNESEFSESFNENSSIYYQTITSANGINYIYGPNTFLTSDGNPVSGSFVITVNDAITNNQMLLMNKPTFTKNGELLVSGGIVKLVATQNGQTLSINNDEPVQVVIPTNDYNPMSFFDGSEDNNGNFGWELEDDTIDLVENFDSTGNGQFTSLGLSFELDSIGWINCDYFYSSGDPLTGVTVNLPEGYTGANSTVFIFYNTINSLATLYDADEDGTFDLGYNYETPIGMDVTFVIVSEIDGQYYYALSPSIITNNHIEEISVMTVVTEEDLENYINGL